jgi:hypothetical protein
LLIRLALWSLVFARFHWCLGVNGPKFGPKFWLPPVDGLDVRSIGRSPAVLLLFGEHVLKALKDNENSFAFKLLERLHEALHVDGAKLMERNKTRATLKAASGTPRVRTAARLSWARR